MESLRIALGCHWLRKDRWLTNKESGELKRKKKRNDKWLSSFSELR